MIQESTFRMHFIGEHFINMNTVSFLFKRDPVKLLGRWNVDYCQQILHTKVKLANEDHCGTCHLSTISEPVKQTITTIKMSKSEKDATRRYNEYINVAIRNRKTYVKRTSLDDINKQIEHYICMN
jgi:hypothetical protein